MEDITMHGVAPMRWNEMRKRVDVLQRFASIGKPAAEDREDAANELGLSVNQFKRLVRSWRLHKDPTALNGAGLPEQKRSHRSDGLDRNILGIINAAITLHGPSAQPTVISETAWSECDRRSLDRPSNGTIWNAIREARRTAGPIVGADREVIIGRAWADLPVRKSKPGTELIRPEILVALQIPERTIIGLASDLALGRPPLATDLDIPEDDRPISVTRHDAGMPARPENRNPIRDRFIYVDSANARFARMMGPSIGNITLAFRLPRTDAGRLLTSVLDTPLSPADAILAIGYAVKAHNDFIEHQAEV